MGQKASNKISKMIFFAAGLLTTILPPPMASAACCHFLCIPDYEKLCKYNLRMVAMSEEERKIAKSERHGNVVVTKPFADAEDDKEKEKKSEDAKKDDDE